MGQGARMYLPRKTGNQFNDIHDYSGSQITQDIYDGYANIGASKDELKEKGLSGLKIPGKMLFLGDSHSFLNWVMAVCLISLKTTRNSEKKEIP